ncbi:PREDICTED: uncharacterized protein LOC109227417 isoform X2 [Nicotiana attenuata]|uniref:Gag1-like clamp domain-containing protein n=1 Tax=Nicotiana attenuata TaxID=49451 RepID=A0A1J6IVG2_NICAT|nr:PREDICTED: uncharacterized protein LOC109227417 isoform X2 [Nicotiana attenuata]XP_019248117.1 PREDICTED: uncharacterized protein LOC109227417 isoform X2 [Nicotiana attenuata]OIT02787.1 hypothetical protein A4A49_37326 [Nicotiana attenuata]
MGGCLGSDSKTKLTSSVHEPLNGQEYLDQVVHKAKLSKDFWTTSMCDMESNSAAQSRGSISSISTSTQTHDAHGAANTNEHSEFVNHGVLLWSQIRQQWVGHKIPEKPKQLLEPKLSWNATYDSLLGSNKPFPKPIPLAEMVDFLVDVWEQEGMYD